MSGEIDISEYAGNGTSVSEVSERAAHYIRRSKARNTLGGYGSDIKQFCLWADEQGIDGTPPLAFNMVADYLASLADDGRKIATIRRRLAGLNWWHSMKGHIAPGTSPEVKATMEGIVREGAKDPNRRRRRARPILVEDLRNMVNALPSTKAGARDRALLLVGFGGALRRSEIAALRVEHVQRLMEGLRIEIPYSKADQKGEGAIIGINRGRDPNLCPVSAFIYWITVSGIKSDAVFRPMNRWGDFTSDDGMTPNAICKVVKTSAGRVLDRQIIKDISGHSLRRGYGTASAIGGGDLLAIKKHMRHASIQTTIEYVEDARVFEENGFKETGL